MVVVFNIKELDLITAERLDVIFQGTGLYFFIAVIIFAFSSFVFSYCWKNAFTYALVPGALSVFTILFGSCAGQMILGTLQGNNQLGTY